MNSIHQKIRPASLLLVVAALATAQLISAAPAPKKNQKRAVRERLAPLQKRIAPLPKPIAHQRKRIALSKGGSHSAGVLRRLD